MEVISYNNIIKELKNNNENPCEFIKLILEKIKNKYSCDYVYFFENDKKSNSHYIFESNYKDTNKTKERDGKYSLPLRWYEQAKEKKVVLFNNIEVLKENHFDTYSILKEYEIESILLLYFNKNNTDTFLELINPKEKIKDANLLMIATYGLFNCLTEIKSSHEDDYNKMLVKIKTFGKMQIEINNKILDESNLKSKQVFKFFIYLLINKSRDVSSDEIARAIWPYQEIMDSYSYIRNIAFRTRKIFNEYIDKDIIVPKNSSYALNSEFKFEIDYDIIDSLYTNLQKYDYSEIEKVDIYENILRLYVGTIFKKYTNEKWLVRITHKYLAIYVDVIVEYSKILIKNRDYQKVLEITEKAIRINNYISAFHYYRILAYIYKNRKSVAEQYLEKAKYILSLKEYNELKNMLKISLF